jgi:D-alanyl-D-alanine carboxypeptidase
MPPETTTKQKILALLTVIILFALVGTIFIIISINNRNKTAALRAEVIRIRKENEIIQKLEKITTATSTLTGITSKSYLTMAITNKGLKKVVDQKNSNLVLPIASITKLMVALITVENLNLESEIIATPNYIGGEESFFVLEADKTYKVKELLANTLIASDNDSARLLSSILGEINFINKMNQKAAELGMTQTKYVNVTGLDPQKPNLDLNTSTVSDLAKLILYINNKHPQILKITINAEYNFCDINNYCKPITSTNKLLTDTDFRFKIIGGKTGSTDLALKNLALMISLNEDISIINIVLGSEDNFTDTKSLINHLIIN